MRKVLVSAFAFGLAAAVTATAHARWIKVRGCNAAERSKWVKPAGQGGVKSCAVYKNDANVSVRRLFGPSNNPFGVWWTDFRLPTEVAARRATAVCKAWNAMTKERICTLPAGTEVLRGPGQTASCGAGEFWKGGPPQTIIESAQTKLEGCRDIRAFGRAVKKPARTGKKAQTAP
jgi:hypothetical protein